MAASRLNEDIKVLKIVGQVPPSRWPAAAKKRFNFILSFFLPLSPSLFHSYHIKTKNYYL